MKLNGYQKFLSLYLVVLVVYWILLYKSGLQDSFWNYFYSFFFSLVPFVAGIAGIIIAKQWGGLKSAIGRTVFFTSFGSFSWGAGSMIWSYYNFFQDVAAPYPGFADIGFVLAIPFWSIGVINLSKATGARIGFRSVWGKILSVVITVGLFAASYHLLVNIARGGTLITSPDEYLKVILDLAYPLSDVVIIILTVLVFTLSIGYLGGLYKKSILALLFGFVVMYFADFTFSYTTTVETFYNGSFGDLLFAIALLFIAFGTLGFTPPRTLEVGSDNV